jgi:signal peptidase I
MIENTQPPRPVTPTPVTAPPPRPERPRTFTHIKKAPEGWSNVVSTIAVLLLAPVVALFLTAFVFQSYQVDGPSMESTLYHNDRLIVWKMSRTWSRITKHPYVPNRGDIVIFAEHALVNYGLDQNKQLIKRVIGLPGDRITIRDGVVTVYNAAHPDGFQPDTTLPYGQGRTMPQTPGDSDVIIPQDKIFVLGDNRGNSLDSSEFGPVAATDIVGKLVVRVLPFDNFKRF